MLEILEVILQIFDVLIEGAVIRPQEIDTDLAVIKLDDSNAPAGILAVLG